MKLRYKKIGKCLKIYNYFRKTDKMSGVIQKTDNFS